MPKYENPDTAWPVGDYIWKNNSAEARKATMRQRIMSGRAHLLREVVLQHPDHPSPYGIEAITHILDAADAEFKFLEQCGISIPDYRWRILTPGNTRPRVFAKVPVIDGESPRLNSAESRAVRQATSAYYATLREGRRLCDIDGLGQYVVGTPRIGHDRQDEAPTPGLYLVDLDPIFDPSWEH